MKKTLSYIFAAALAALFTLQSCGLEEPFNESQSGISEGTVEFVARPASYNNHEVTTKADGNPSTFEDDEIHNAFLLVFNQAGQRLLCEEINLTTEDGKLTTAYNQLSAKIDRAMGEVTACILANVPASFARGITNLESLNTAVLDLKYDYSKSGILGVPVLDLDDDTKAVPCIPMFGQKEVNLSTSDPAVGIDLKRLFAKITVDLSLNVNLDNAGDALIGSATYFELTFCNLKNMPTKVRLVENDSQSDWYNQKSSFSDLSGGPRNLRVYNRNSSETFTFYVPEYYLNSIDNPSKDEKQKPNNVQNGTFPIYLFLNGTYSQYSFNSTVLEYKVYLGRNEHSDFSLARNVNYINYLKITGINNHDGEGAVEIDYRVSTTIINNPVAKEGKSANCYIIAATGEYSFPAYKGAYNDLTDAALCNHETAVELREAKNDNSGNIVLSGLSYDPDQNMISFNIDKIDNGNVVIELKNKDGSTEWSWHLWCSKESTLSQMLPGDLGAWGKLNNHTYPNGSIMMDRNLGASSTSATGLYYKYGSKNPFITDNYYGSGTNGSATWLADDKAVNDPCPPGYRVPDISCWSIETGGKDGSIGAFLYWQSGTTFIYYPYSGYINSNMQIITDITQPYTHTGTYEPVLAVTVAGSGYEYRNLTYTLPIDKDSGALLSSDNRLFVYEDTNDGLLSDITITGGEYRSKIKIFGYEKWGDWTKINTSSYSKPGQLALTAAEEVLADVPEIKKFIEPSMKIDTSNALNGYNVRCEAE